MQKPTIDNFSSFRVPQNSFSIADASPGYCPHSVIMCIYEAHNSSPNLDCYFMGAVPDAKPNPHDEGLPSIRGCPPALNPKPKP